MGAHRKRQAVYTDDDINKFARTADARNVSESSELCNLTIEVNEDANEDASAPMYDWCAGILYGTTKSVSTEFPIGCTQASKQSRPFSHEEWKYNGNINVLPMHLALQAYLDRTCVQYVSDKRTQHTTLKCLAYNTLHEVMAAARQKGQNAPVGGTNSAPPRELSLWLIVPNSVSARVSIQDLIDAYAHLASSPTSEGYPLASKIRMQLVLGENPKAGEHLTVINIFRQHGVQNLPGHSLLRDGQYLLMGVTSDQGGKRFISQTFDLCGRPMDRYLQPTDPVGVGWNTPRGKWMSMMVSAIQHIGRDMNLPSELCTLAATIEHPPQENAFRKMLRDHTHKFFGLFSCPVPSIDDQTISQLELSDSVAEAYQKELAEYQDAQTRDAERRESMASESSKNQLHGTLDDTLSDSDDEDDEERPGDKKGLAEQEPAQEPAQETASEAASESRPDPRRSFQSDLRPVTLSATSEDPLMFRITKEAILLQEGQRQELVAQGPDLDSYTDQSNNALNREEVMIRQVAKETPMAQAFPGVLICDPAYHTQVRAIFCGRTKAARIEPCHLDLLSKARAVMMMYWTTVISAEPYLSLYVGNNIGSMYTGNNRPIRDCPTEFPVSRIVLTSLTPATISKWYMEPCQASALFPTDMMGLDETIIKEQHIEIAKCLDRLVLQAEHLGAPETCKTFRALESSGRLPKSWEIFLPETYQADKERQEEAAQDTWNVAGMDEDDMMLGLDTYGTAGEGDSGLMPATDQVSRNATLRDLAIAVINGPKVLHTLCKDISYALERFGPLVDAHAARDICLKELQEHGRLVSTHRERYHPEDSDRIFVGLLSQ